MNLHEEDPSTSRSQKLLCPECLSKIHSFVQKPSTRAEMHETALARLRSGSTVSTDTDKQATEAFIDEVKLDLVSYDMVIDELENKLVELKRARSASSHHLATAQALASPVWKVPPEIWTEIFSSYASENRKTTFPATDLVAICSTWRAIVLSTPRIWSFLNIRSSDRVLSTLARDISHSKEAPLTIKIHYSSVFDQRDREIFDILLNLAYRWRDIEFHGPASPGLHYWLSFAVAKQNSEPEFGAVPSKSGTHFPALNQLYLPGSISSANEKLISRLFGAVPLRSFHGEYITWPLASTVLDFSHLTYLRGTQVSEMSLGHFLCHFPALKELHLDQFDVELPVFKTGNDLLPNGEEFFISGISKLHLGYISGSKNALWTHLRLPKLTSLTLVHHEHDDAKYGSFCTLLLQSQCALQSLKLHRPSMANVIDLTLSQPSLLHLQISGIRSFDFLQQLADHFSSSTSSSHLRSLRLDCTPALKQGDLDAMCNQMCRVLHSRQSTSPFVAQLQILSLQFSKPAVTSTANSPTTQPFHELLQTQVGPLWICFPLSYGHGAMVLPNRDESSTTSTDSMNNDCCSLPQISILDGAGEDSKRPSSPLSDPPSANTPGALRRRV